MRARERAALIEHLVPVLDALAKDLLQMAAVTAIELEQWPSAQQFLALWEPDRLHAL